MTTKLTTDDFAWTFGSNTYDNFADFLAEFTDYNQKIMRLEPPLEDFPICQESTITLLFEGVAEGSEDYDELSTTITSRNGGALTFLEFMFLANNALYEYLCDADHVFYEGIEPEETEDGSKVFRLIQGS